MLQAILCMCILTFVGKSCDTCDLQILPLNLHLHTCRSAVIPSDQLKGAVDGLGQVLATLGEQVHVCTCTCIYMYVYCRIEDIVI